MQCPRCQSQPLIIAHRHDIEIDYCQQCAGIWLDKGELEKIIELSNSEGESTAESPTVEPTKHRSHHAEEYRSFYNSRMNELLNDLINLTDKN